MLKKISLYLFLLFVSISFANAQSGTTASINGIVTNSEGRPMVGTTIKALHGPTGTVVGAITNTAGRFNIIGLRVGGPYVISASMVGYDTQSEENLFLAINQNLSIDFIMSEVGITTDVVTVIADRNDIITTSRTGASQAVTEADINSLPTISRSLHDYSRLSPHIVSSTSAGSNVGGRNSKYNNIQVDGAIMSDAFGLSTAGTPGGQAGAEPISLDAIQEFQVAIAPFDVRLGGFTGGLINAITRSGSNRFRGSVYYYGRNEKLVGNSALTNPDGSRNPYPEYTDFQAGGRFGGPIIENKLFFFMNGEISQRAEPQLLVLKGETGANVYGLSKSEISEIHKYLINEYGYNPGGYENYTRNVNNYKFFFRFDYNISQKYRLTLRHNLVNAAKDNAVGRSRNFFSFDGQEYIFRSLQNQTVLQLNSIIASNMANEFRVAFTQINDKRDFQSSPFPSVTISQLGDDLRSSLSFGVERFSQTNALDQNILEITNNFNYFIDDHVFTIGTTSQYIKFSNLFVQDKFGTYTFQGLENFYNKTPSRYYFSYLNPDGNERAEFSYWQIALYVQDEWTVLPNLKLTFGLRGDLYAFPDNPSYNELFNDKFGMRTDEMPTTFAFSPRLGFNYDVFSNKMTQIRGGIGLFAGRTPGVWIGNQYANTGVDYGRVDVSTNSPGSPDSKVPIFNPDPFNQPRPGIDPNLVPIQTSEVNITDKNFKMPQVLRFNVGLDHQILDGLIGTVEFIYGKTMNDVLYQNLNLKDSVIGGQRQYTIDGRPLYSNFNFIDPAFTNVIYMTNTDLGDQMSLSFQLQKPFGQGFIRNLNANFAYTYSQARDVNSAASSIAISNWMFNHAIDPNNPELSISLFAISHRILANVSYRWVYDRNSAFTVGLFYEGRSGSPYSFVYWSSVGHDANYDNFRQNDLAYIPKKLEQDPITGLWQDDKFILANGTNRWALPNGDTLMIYQLLEEFINSHETLKDQRGKISERFSHRQPWRHQVDIRLSQEIPVYKGQKLEFTLDILNVLNLLSPDWGHSLFVSNANYELFRFDGYNAENGKIQASYFPNTRGKKPKDIFETSDFWSRWQMQFGIRYTF